MAIFKRNRDKKKNALPAAAATTEPAASQTGFAISPTNEPVEPVQQPAAQPDSSFTPVLAYGAESAAKAPVVSAPADTEVEGKSELDSIAGIFGAVDSTPAASAMTAAAAETLTASQERWRTRRQRAMEQAKGGAKPQVDPYEAAAIAGDAPAIEPMKSISDEKKAHPRRGERTKPENPVSLAFADLSGRTDLEPSEIEDATDIYGIKYPAGFDTSQVVYSGRAIDFSNFSLVEGLRWKHIEDASDISGIVFPSSLDIENCVFFGRSLRSCDFSHVYALRWRHIESAEDIVAIKYPATFDIVNANYDQRSISGSDFSLVQQLRWEHIENAADISGIRYPAGFDVEDAVFEGRDISGSDFSLLASLRWEHIREAVSVEGIIYPKEFNFTDADFRGMDISGSDFSRAQSFDFSTIAGAADIRSIKYPECFDSSKADFSGRDISGSNFSRVSSLRFAHIKDAADLTRLVYPPQFDIDEADFAGRCIDYSDFSLLPGFNWQSVRLADGREGLVYPASFVVPVPSDDEIEGSMLIFLLKMYNREYRSNLDITRFYGDIAALYPGIDDIKAAELIDAVTARWEQPDGKKLVELTAREAHIGDKLFMTKLGFKLLYPRHGLETTENLLREQFTGLFKRHEQERFERRLSDLRKGRYLSASELSEIGFEPVLRQKTERLVEVEESEVVQPTETILSSESPAAVISDAEAINATDSEVAGVDAEALKTTDSEVAGVDAPDDTPEKQPTKARVHSFGYVAPESIDMEGFIDATSFVAPETPEPAEPEYTEPAEPVAVLPVAQFEPVVTSDTLKQSTQPEAAAATEPEKAIAPTVAPAIAQESAQPDPSRYVAKPVDINKLRQKRAAQQKRSATQPSSRKERLSDEEKAIRTGVMGMLLYIHQNTSDEDLTNAELFSEFMKIYPGAVPKEAAAMAQFATDTLGGTNTETRAKLFMFASRSSAQVKRKLLDFAYNEYIYRLVETADEEIFRDFLMALCDTLYEDSPEYEYSSYLRSRDILKDPPLRREANYRRISFEQNIGKANLYANEKFPYYRTLQQVGFQHYTFDAIRNSLLIEVSDSRYYEELDNLVYRERHPNLLQFVIIETQMGYLYLEQRCIDDWQVDERDVWAAAEQNMRTIDIRAKYSFASSEFSSFRYIQHDLASYVLSMPDLFSELSCGQDMILALPCREIVYIDFYDFGAIKRLLEFTSRYNCTLIIGGEEFEHPFSPDVFIYHAADGSFERVNDETYILLGDSVARRQVLRAVLPLNVEFNQDRLQQPRPTDAIETINEEYCVVQEAVFTLLRLYSEMNGDSDYTIPQNAMMAVTDELFVTFDGVYPPSRGREQPDPIDHIDDAARMAMKGGKTMCWLMIQAIQYLCGDIKYETPSSAHIRETVLEVIYGANANAVWLNCATASDFAKRYEAVRRFFEKPVENQRMTMLNSKVEVAMHALTMIFHQFGNRYALGEVRRHIYRAIPEVEFTYEINQAAWLPAPGDDVDVDAQSLGMIFRGFDRSSQERMLTAFADSIGDRDLSEGGWPLLYFIKFVKYSYLDPVEMVERYFVRRSRLIPSQTVLKQLYYKDLNNEFVKHTRVANRMDVIEYDDAFDDRARSTGVGSENLARSVEGFDSLLAIADDPELTTPVILNSPELDDMGYQKPDLQFAPVEQGYLEKRLSFVLEDVNVQVSNSLREAAHYVTKVFHVPEVMFKTNDDIECELHYGILRSREQLTTLRSFAWTLAGLIFDTGRDMRDVTEMDIARTVETVEDNNRINYKPNTKYFPVLCSMPLDEGLYIPSHQEYIFFAQELLPEARLASLFTLQDELMQLAPAMKLAYDLLREQKRGDIMPPRGVLFDVLCAWSAYAFASGDAFEVVRGPQMYNYNQIVR